MKTGDSKFKELNPEQYIEDLGANYTRLSFLEDKIQEGFKAENDEPLSEMEDLGAHVEIEYKGQRLFIDEVIKKVSALGVKKMIIHVDDSVI